MAACRFCKEFGDKCTCVKKPDMVNHPPHYNQHPKGIECIDVIEENPFPNLANAIRYLWRVSWGGKFNDLEDLEKAKWYVEREISRRRKNQAIVKEKSL